MSTIKKGDKVEILIGGSDPSKFGMTREMAAAKGEIGIVRCVVDAPRGPIAVRHPSFSYPYSYSADELRKVEPARTQEFKHGDRVKIVSHGSYGSNRRMDEGLNGYGKVVEAGYPGPLNRKARVRVALDGGLGTYVYDQHELKHAPTQHPAVGKKVVQEVTMAVTDEVDPPHIQSHDELVAENESLEKQIRKLEARVERKKEFQRQNARKIAAWKVILGE